ncbi:MAG: hypothetical protein ACRYFS_25240 [Janthinobacterium lividum]
MAAPHPNHVPQGLTVTHGGGGGGEDEPIYSARLKRDGWGQSQPMKAEYTRTNAGFVTHTPGIRRKQNPQGWQKLTMTSTLSHYEMNEEFSVRYADGIDLPLDGAEWADWDQRGRLVFAKAGKIYAVEAGSFGQESPRELVDLNDHKPEPMEAPGWAKVW